MSTYTYRPLRKDTAWSYNAEGDNRKLFAFTNNNNYSIRITGLSIRLGVADKNVVYDTGNTVTGSGQAISVSAVCSTGGSVDSTAMSGTVTTSTNAFKVSKKIGNVTVTIDGIDKLNPDKANITDEYNFNLSCSVPAGKTIYIGLTTVIYSCLVCNNEDGKIKLTYTDEPIWKPNSAGKDINITDNGDNTATIKVPKFDIGTNNGISPDTKDTGARGYQGKYIFIEFLTSKGDSLAIYRRDFPNVTSDFSETFKLLKDTAKISVWAKGVSTYGSPVEKSKLNVSVVYYVAPGRPILTWISKGIVNNPKSRVKKELTWKWENSSAPSRSDGKTPEVKYRAYIFKNNTNVNNSINLANSIQNATGYPIETASKSLTFIPADYGFVARDSCICRVWSYIEAKNGHIHWSSDCAQASCQLFNSVNVWVKTADGADPSTWKEAESVWIKTDNGWKEAEDLWIKTTDDTWSESS